MGCKDFFQYILPYTLSALITLGWLAVQVLCLVEGGRFIEDTPCNRPLARYLLVSGALAFFSLLILGIPGYLLAFTPSERTHPTWRKMFFGSTSRYRTLQEERCPNGLWPGSPRRKVNDQVAKLAAQQIAPNNPLPVLPNNIVGVDDLSDASDNDNDGGGAMITNSDKSLLINTLYLSFSYGAILANKLPQHATTKKYRRKLHHGQEFRVWTPPRSTSLHTSRSNGFANQDVMATHAPMAKPIPLLPPTPIDPLFCAGSDDSDDDNNNKNNLINVISDDQGDDNNNDNDDNLIKMPQSEVNLNFRAVAGGYAYNSIYSLVPPNYRSTPQWVWTLGIGAVIVVLVTALAGVGWLIYGTYETSKSGVGECLPELYKTSLSVVIINWSAPALVALLMMMAGCW